MENKLNTRRGENPLTKRREPMQFLLALGVFGSALLFLLIVGVYLLRRTAADWSTFALPPVFYISTGVIVVSSLTLHLARAAFRTDRYFAYRLWTGLTLALGTVFITLQLVGWLQMHQRGITLNGNVAGAFVYLLSGLHLFHILGGLAFLVVIFLESLRRTSYVESFVYSVNPPNQMKIKLVTLYWHFVDALWLLLFAFLLVQHH